jgi:hypothetical protein
MPKWSAVLLATGALPASIHLQPWFESDRSDEIRSAVHFSHRAMEDAAQPAAPPPPSPDQLVTVNTPKPDGDDKIDLTKDGGDRVDPPTAEQPVLATAGAPAAAGRTATSLPPPPADAPTGRTAALYSQEGERIGSTTVDTDDPTLDIGELTGRGRRSSRFTKRKRR